MEANFGVNPGALIQNEFGEWVIAGMEPGNSLLGGVGGGTETAATTAGSGGFTEAMGNASIGLAIGQAIGGAYSAIQGGKTLKYVAKRQAEIAEANRQMGQLSAESAIMQGQGQIAKLTYRAGQVRAKQRAGFAANGVVLNSGSTGEVTASTDILKEQDKNTIRMNALANAWGFRRQALQANAQAAHFSSMSQYAGKLGIGQAAGSLLEGGAEVADRWYKFKGGFSHA